MEKKMYENEPLNQNDSFGENLFTLKNPAQEFLTVKKRTAKIYHILKVYES